GLAAALADLLDRRGERVEAVAQPRQRRARGLGELHAASGAAEQFHTEVILEAFHLVADRRLRDRELVRGFLEGKMARGGLEYPQCVQGRKAVNHVTDLSWIVEFFLCKT